MHHSPRRGTHGPQNRFRFGSHRPWRSHSRMRRLPHLWLPDADPVPALIRDGAECGGGGGGGVQNRASAANCGSWDRSPPPYSRQGRSISISIWFPSTSTTTGCAGAGLLQ
eukprot:scaffold38036_cov50-Attheya_sp.AAC.1